MFDQRNFLQSLAALMAAVPAPPALLGRGPSGDSDALGTKLPCRALGRTGEKVTMLGVGGWHIGRMSEPVAQATLEAALAGGVRFFDNSEDYNEGGSEKRYGRLLVPKYREHVFLMTKTNALNAKQARQSLEASLRRLNTDRIDLWQMHALQDPDDVDRRLAAGVLEVMFQAKEQGKVRHIGFTGHHEPAAHLRMIDRARGLETAQMPVNALDPSRESFIEKVLPRLVERGYGVLAMKTLANGRFFQSYQHGGKPTRLIPDRLTIEEAEHFVWSLPVSVLIAGPENPRQIEDKIHFARSFAGMSPAQRHAIVRKVADLATQNIEYYKA